MPSNSARVARVLALAVAYWAAGRLSEALAIPPGFTVPVWPSAGIALGAVLVWGVRVWPGVLLGSFALNASQAMGEVVAADPIRAALIGLGIAGGAVLQALAGSWLVHRHVGYPNALERPSDIALFLVLAGPLACLVNATWAVGVLLLAGAVPASQFAVQWTTWWVGDTIGVLVWAPLVLVFFGKPAQAWRPRRATVAVPLLAGFLAVAGLFVLEGQWEASRARTAFAERTDLLVNALRGLVDRHVGMTAAVTSVYELGARLDRDTFRALVERSLARHPGVHAISWSPRVAHAQREAYEGSVRAAGTPDYAIRQPGPDGAMVPAEARAEYFPIRLIEPLERNARALGFDLASDASRRAAMDRAVEGGAVQVTPPVRLPQEPGAQNGVLFVWPAFAARSRPATAEERRADLAGFVSTVIRVGDLVDAAFAGLDRHGIQLRLVDEDAPPEQSVLHADATGRGTVARDPPLARSVALEVGGRTWRADFSAGAGYYGEQQGRYEWFRWVALIGGLLLVALLGALLLLDTGRRRQMARVLAELREKKEEAEAATLAKSRLLAYASHDLRQPMHALGLFVARLRQLPQDAETHRLAGSIERSVRALQDLLDGLLDISRLDAGAVEPSRRPVAVSGLWTLLQADFAAAAADKGIALRLHPSRAWLMTDPVLLHRILLNLVSNAIRYTASGGVLLACRRRGANAWVEVWDTGSGIAPEAQAAVFEEFVQLGNPERDRSKGLGLGLAIVERTARLLGHRLSLRSVPGKGSRFRLEVPLAAPEERAPEAWSAAGSPSTDLARVTVLIVDDDALGRRALADLLESWGCVALEAADADEARGLLAEGCVPDLIACDYRLPKRVDAVRFVAELRVALGRDVPAFLVSGDTGREIFAAASTAELPLLHKPVRPARLRALVQRLVQSSAPAP